MTVLQILLQIWQSIPIRVGLLIVSEKIQHRFFLPKLFQTVFFLGGGGGGGWGCCKNCWVRQRERASLARFPL